MAKGLQQVENGRPVAGPLTDLFDGICRDPRSRKVPVIFSIVSQSFSLELVVV